MSLFYILNGNNRATYILNTKNWDTITESLHFYQARSFKAKILKKGLSLYLWIKALLFPKGLRSLEEIQKYLQVLTEEPLNFEIDNNSSILISPTRNKIIVHHHRTYFQKFAFDESYQKVKNEANIYAIFAQNPKYFQISEFSESANISNKCCTFKLSNKHLNTEKCTSPNLSMALVEFFNTSKEKSISLANYINTLIQEINKSHNNSLKNQSDLLNTIKKDHGSLELTLGLVHRDFKPWNIKSYTKPLIFDFEEATTAGPPLEDLLNFYIDPIIRYLPTKEVAQTLLNEPQVKSYNVYLKALNIKIDNKILIHIYLINRIIFWTKAGELETSKAYLNLSNHMINHYTV